MTHSLKNRNKAGAWKLKAQMAKSLARQQERGQRGRPKPPGAESRSQNFAPEIKPYDLALLVPVVSEPYDLALLNTGFG